MSTEPGLKMRLLLIHMRKPHANCIQFEYGDDVNAPMHMCNCMTSLWSRPPWCMQTEWLCFIQWEVPGHKVLVLHDPRPRLLCGCSQDLEKQCAIVTMIILLMDKYRLQVFQSGKLEKKVID